MGANGLRSVREVGKGGFAVLVGFEGSWLRICLEELVLLFLFFGKMIYLILGIIRSIIIKTFPPI